MIIHFLLYNFGLTSYLSLNFAVLAETVAASKVYISRSPSCSGNGRLYEGKHKILFSRGHGEESSFELVVPRNPHPSNQFLDTQFVV